MDYWDRRCPMTGITEPELLRASHIVPWADCTDTQRLDVHNGLLLSALWDAAFDRGLVSSADDGAVLANPKLSETARKALDLATRRRSPDCATRIGRIWLFTAHAMDLMLRPNWRVVRGTMLQFHRFFALQAKPSLVRRALRSASILFFFCAA